MIFIDISEIQYVLWQLPNSFLSQSVFKPQLIVIRFALEF